MKIQFTIVPIYLPQQKRFFSLNFRSMFMTKIQFLIALYYFSTPIIVLHFPIPSYLKFGTTTLHSERVAWRLERLPTVPKTMVRDPPRANGWTLAHCPPSSEWGPGGNTGEIKAARTGTGHPTSKSRWPRASFLSNRHSPTYGSYMGLIFALHYLIL